MTGRPSPILIGFLLFPFLLPAFALAADDPVTRADELYRKRKDRANVLAAVEILAEALEKEPGDYEILWRLARCYWFLGDRAAGKDRLAYFEKGRAFAEKATKANDAGIDGHYWHAALIGCVGQERGILNSLFMIPSIRRELERCLELDPRHAEAHDVMGQLLW
ncbi:MAG: tetratricopeptide repeat protein, partial [Firmicutes bacterium]|nr:tetratricopeptide repeat protein [Bacillota bacterium]